VRKEEMCFLKLQDTTGSIEVVVFPRAYSEARDILTTDRIIIVSGKVESNEETPVLIAEKISLLEQIKDSRKASSTEAFEVIIPSSADRILISKVYEVLKGSPGEISTYLVLPGNDSLARKIPIPFGIQKTTELETQLRNLGCRVLKSN